MERGLHQSKTTNITFLREEFELVVGKGQWLMLLYALAKELLGLRLRKRGTGVLLDGTGPGAMPNL